MPVLKPNFSFEVTNTYVTDINEGKIEVKINYNDPAVEGNSAVNTVYTVADVSLGVGVGNDPKTANVINLLYSALPSYFDIDVVGTTSNT